MGTGGRGGVQLYLLSIITLHLRCVNVHFKWLMVHWYEEDTLSTDSAWTQDTLTVISSAGWSINMISDSSPSSITDTECSPNSSSERKRKKKVLQDLCLQKTQGPLQEPPPHPSEGPQRAGESKCPQMCRGMDPVSGCHQPRPELDKNEWLSDVNIQ